MVMAMLCLVTAKISYCSCVLHVSGYADRDIGNREFILKPFDAVYLTHRIRALLRRTSLEGRRAPVQVTNCYFGCRGTHKETLGNGLATWRLT